MTYCSVWIFEGTIRHLVRSPLTDSMIRYIFLVKDKHTNIFGFSVHFNRFSSIEEAACVKQNIEMYGIPPEKHVVKDDVIYCLDTIQHVFGFYRTGIKVFIEFVRANSL